MRANGNTIVVVDVYALIYRAYYAFPALTDNSGNPTGAIFGTISLLCNVCAKYRAHQIVLASDSYTPSFRKELYPEYKSNRRTMPEDLVAQISPIREFLQKCGLTFVEKDRYEADDIIASLCSHFRKHKILIVSADKDLMQLIDERVQMYDISKNNTVDIQAVINKYSVPPEKMCDLQGLIGDASDNVPGVPGVGIKTASKLLQEYCDIEHIYSNINHITPLKIQTALLQNKDRAFLSKKLVTLVRDIDLSQYQTLAKLESAVIHMNTAYIATFLQTYNITSLGAKIRSFLPDFDEKQPVDDNVICNNITDQHHAIHFSQKIHGNSCITIYPCIKEGSKSIKTIYLFLKDDDTYHVHFLQQKSLFEQQGIDQHWFLDQIAQKKPHIIGISNSISLMPITWQETMTYDDISIMRHILGEARSGSQNEKTLKDVLPHAQTSYAQIKIFEDDVQPLVSKIIFEEYVRLKQKLNNNQELEKIYTLDMDTLRISNRMQRHGICLDVSALNKAATYFTQQMKSLEHKIFAEAEMQFNIASAKQTSGVLFKKMRIPSPTKNYSTDHEVLEELAAQGYIIADYILQWRKIFKLYTTYVKGLQEARNSQTGKIHTTFHIHGTSTGRLSSSNPNLQNIPIKTHEGKMVRKAFVSSPRYVLASFDYSQIELRVLAHLADITPLKQAFMLKQDVHMITAQEVCGSLDLSLEEKRRLGKSLNFGLIYGMSIKRLATILHIEHNEAKEYMQKYFEKFPGFVAYKDKILDFARRYAFVKTAFGRHCYIPNINHKNHAIRTGAERQAINAVIQGSAADIIKIAMCKIEKNKKLKTAQMILQIHDELIFELPHQETESLAQIICNEMKNAVELSIPLEVNYAIAENLSEL